MALVRLRDYGKGGVASTADSPSVDLPPHVFTSCRNTVFRNGAARKAPGYLNVINEFPADAIWFDSWQQAADTVTVVFGHANSISTSIDVTDIDVAVLHNQSGTPIATMPSVTESWQSDVFGQFMVMNNGVDIPMYSHSFASPVWTFRQIPGWGVGSVVPSGPVSVIRTAYNHLIAIGVASAPYTVYCSEAGSPETFPQVWEILPTTTARSFPVQTSDGPLVDGGMLNGRFILYQRYGCSLLDYIGGSYLFSLTKGPPIGLLNRDAFAQFQNWHLVVGEGEIVIHDGASIQRLDDNRVRKRFFNDVADPTKVRCAHDPKNREVVIYYNDNRTLTFNYDSATWAFGKLEDDIKRIATTVLEIPGKTWGEMTLSWADAADSWAIYGNDNRVAKLFQLQSQSLDERNTGYKAQDDDQSYALWSASEYLMVNASGDHLLWEAGELRDYDAWAERRYIDLDEVVGDSAHVKRVMAAYLQVDGQGQCDIQFGISDTQRDPPRWGPIQSIDFDTEPRRERVDLRLAGRYLHWRIGSWDDARHAGSWAISGMDLDVGLEGKR